MLNLDPQTREAIAIVRRAAERLYGDRLEQILLYGSRARGDWHDESDVDLAVVVRGAVPDRLAEADRLMAEAFVPTMETGRVVQPVVVSAPELAAGRTFFLKNVREEGVPL